MATKSAESRPPLIPSQLQSARESLVLSLEDAAGLLGIQPSQLLEWESGISQPAVEQVWALAQLYNRDVDYFLMERRPVHLQLTFRLPQPSMLSELPVDARKVLVRFEELCRVESELESLLGRLREIRIKKLGDEREPEELASQVRKSLGREDGPIKNIRRLLEEQGIRTFELDVPGNAFSGFSWWHPDYGPCILANYLDVLGRRSFTFAHEYAHLLLDHRPGGCDLRRVNVDIGEERFANLFAVAFLMPAADLIEYVRSKEVFLPSLSDRQLGSLAAHYNVSMEAMGRRLEELRLVPKGFTDSRIERWEARRPFYRKSKTPKWHKQLGEPFISLAFQAYNSGRISVGRLSHHLGVDIREVL